MKKNIAETVIVTVGTTEQKKLCEKLISGMKESSFYDVIVVCDEDIIGIFPNRINEKYAVSSLTKRILKITEE